MKVCTKCGRTLDESMFSKRATAKDGLRSQCKDCDKQYYIDKEKKIEEVGEEQYIKQQKEKEEAYKKARIRVCPKCGKSFEVPKLANGNYSHRIYCSDKCSGILDKKVVTHTENNDTIVSEYPMLTCVICGKEFIGKYNSSNKRATDKKYCSVECEKIALERWKESYQANKKRVCAYCGKEFIVPRLADGHFSEMIYCSDDCRHVGSSKNQLMANEQRKITCQKKYGVDFPCLSKQCREANDNIISNINKKFADFLMEHGIYCDFEFSIERRAYDLIIRNTNILIELNPSYTHTVAGNHYNNYKYNEYFRHSQLDKTQLAERHGYRCIHVWDWDDWNKILNSIKNDGIVIYARELKITEIDRQDANTFLIDNHIQGKCKGNIVNLGLYKDNELVQVMTFGKPRYNKNYEWELLRLCTHSGMYVVGGAERLFKHFVRDYNPESIMSYCDISKFSGDVYERLGFKLREQTKPAKIWSKGTIKITDNLLRMRGYDQLFKTNYGKGTSNEQLMLDNGWLPVYDCGQKVFEYTKNNNSL